MLLLPNLWKMAPCFWSIICLFFFFLPYNEKKVIFISRGLHIYEIFSYILSQEIFEKLSHM